MKRLELIRAALKELHPCGVPPQPYGCSGQAQPHISRSVLMELTECLYYLCFPEVMIPSARVVPSFVQPENLTEWVLGHVTDIMCSQITFAFILHGDVHAVEEIAEFSPLETSQRTPLDWNVPQGGTLTVVHAENGDQAGVVHRCNDDDDAKKSQTEKCPIAAAAAATNGTGPSSAQAQYFGRCKAKAEAIVAKFLAERLPLVRWLLHTDVEAIFRNDVAATSPSEVVLCYPAVRCMLHQRVAHQLFLLGVPTNFTRMLTEIAHSITGIDIHPRTPIGHHFFIDHGTGIVVGATAIIGNYVSLYQGVTLGAKSFPTDKKTGERILNLPRHPIIEDGVTIYANAVALGRVTIGEGSTIGGNCWVVRDVAPFSTIVQKSNHVLQPHERMFLEKDGSGI
uniref:serine O-acetyltransferase n=1 Tax=Herpetomonas muscarum TaxID=5718 RepID=U5KL69_HERMU|nr:serine O-acetyltransferase [Herpetomonas muscarum]